MARERLSTLLVAVLAGTACAGGPRASEPDRHVAVYAAVIRHMTAEKGQASGYPVIYVLDRLDPAAGNPASGGEPTTPIPEEVQAGIRQGLTDVGNIEFISDADSVKAPEGQGGRVKGGGILLTLGPIRGEGERVQVPANGYLGNLAAWSQTWVVERRDGAWSVTGTTGPIAVS